MKTFFTNRETRLKRLANGYISHKKIRGLKTTCAWFPCHKKLLQDCTFCICPFFPCKDRELGRWFEYEKDGIRGKVWDCTDCTLNHHKNIAPLLLEQITDCTDIKNNLTKFSKIKHKFKNLIDKK